jgi:hypothetical protein
MRDWNVVMTSPHDAQYQRGCLFGLKVVRRRGRLTLTAPW